MRLKYNPFGVLNFFTRKYTKILVDASSLESLGRDFLKIDNGWYNFLKSESPLANKLLQKTVLGSWSESKAAGWVSETFLELKRLERRSGFVSEYGEGDEAGDLVVLDRRNLQEEVLVFLGELCYILEVPYIISTTS
jgi:hypothetical protein